MSDNQQTPLERYVTKRGGDVNTAFQDLGENLPGHTMIRVASWLVILGFAAYLLIPRTPAPLQLTYEMDLENAPEGSLVITLITEGDLPRNLNLEFPPGVFGDAMNGVNPHSATANVLNPDGSQGKSLAVKRTPDGWDVATKGAKRAGFIYQVDLNHVQGLDGNVRHHISTPVTGGLRVAGFEVFLQPVGREVGDITVTLHNPENIQVLVPWPALVQNGHLPSPPSPAPKPVQQANVSPGQGYLPAEGVTPPEDQDPGQAPATRSVPSNLLFHPQDLEDLNNALLICGDIQVISTQVRETVVQLATDHQWQFPFGSALDMVRRIARTEMGFFGTAPTSQITVILSANKITGRDKFDIYGVHTGSSVLVMMDADTTWEELEDQCASVIAHEMFHGWLGEAIPQKDPDMLWFTEGAATWYAARMLTAAGIWTPDHSRAVLQTRMERDYKLSPLKTQMSVGAAAADVMASPDQVRFAYAGAINACMNLDQWLSEQTGKTRPLDQVLRHLYENRDGSPLTRLAFETAVLEATGVDCSVWLDDYVYKKTTLPAAIRLI
ncbi:MAG: M1 family aminopeptidase [Candidatus Krumholzibacteriota bacterium]